jgi:hypothetical protein
MTTHPLVTQPAIPSPQLGIAAKLCLTLLGVLGLGAAAGGAILVGDPDGSTMQLSLALLSGSLFADFMVPGLILGSLFGLGSFVVAGFGIAGVRAAPFLAFAIGVAQMVWIAVELAIIGELSFLHPTLFAIGLAIAATAARWGWPTFEAWRASR